MIALKPVCFTLALVGIATAPVSTGQVQRRANPPRQATASASVKTTRPTAIVGDVSDVNGAPMQNATVRLRNLASRRIEQTVKPDHLGRFSLAVQPDVPYVIEIVGNDGQIIAVGDIITAQAGEVAAVSLAVPTKLPAAAGLFSDTIGSVVSAITSAGITVLPDAPPLSPER